MTTLRALAEMVNGETCGDDNVELDGASTLRWAQSGQISLLENDQYLRELAQSQASAVVATLNHRDLTKPAILVSNPAAAFAQIVRYFRPLPKSRFFGISTDAHIDPSAKLASGVVVYPHAFIDSDVVIGERTVIHSGCRILAGTRIGSDCTIFPNAVLYEGTQVGDRVIIHAGAVLGAYGFGYTTEQGRHRLSPQLGYVQINDDVEIGACSTIDRGTYDATVIGEGTKIDNQVMIGHNCHIGRNNVLCSQVGIAGSCNTGDYVIMAGQAGVRDHVDLCDGVVLGAQAGIHNHIKEAQRLFGSPAREEREQLVINAAITRLPAMRKQLMALERLCAQLQANSKQAGIELHRDKEQQSDAA
jgi:UDP-3-O-[3-hydroxymyristoyl] glucosamine N-acyltransferase